MPYLGRQPGVGVRNRYIYTATASQTTFSGADDNGATLAYDDAAYVDVYLNGVLLIPVTDYAATTKTSVVLTSGAAASDLLEILAYEISSIADTVSKANGGTFDGAITVNGNLSVDNGTIKLDGNYPVGTGNVALGDTALDSVTTGGDYNTAVGRNVLTATTSGQQNTAVGNSGLAGNTTGSFNDAFGSAALLSNTSGNYNVALGSNALRFNTTADNNIAVGYQAGYSNTTGTGNQIFGTQAGYGLTTGNANTAVGWQALQTTSTGSDNTAIGAFALQSNTSGQYNTAVGRQALTANTASFNTALGYQAGANITTGSYNTYIGLNVSGSSTSTSGELVVSADSSATGKGTNTGYINPGGITSSGVYQGNNSSSWATTSDQRLKKNIVDNSDGLNKITAIQVRNFEYRQPDEVTELDPSYALSKTGVQLGVIAQELQQICPECVKEESTGVLSVNPDNVFWHMVNAIKELSAKNEALEARITALETN